MKYQIRTLAKHEAQHLKLNNSDEGQLWQACEIEADAWFAVEAAVSHGTSEPQVRRWVTTNVETIVAIKHELNDVHWFRVFVCLPAPLTGGGTNLFEEFLEAYESSSGVRSYLFARGKMFWGESGFFGGPSPPPEDSKLIFKNA